MNLLYCLLKEFEKEYNLKLCVYIDKQLIYGNNLDKDISINFKCHDKDAYLYFDKKIDNLSINYLISVINNIYKNNDVDILLKKLFINELDEHEDKILNNYLDNRRYCLAKLYFNNDLKLENVVDNIFECKYIFIHKDKAAYLLIEKEDYNDKLLLELKDTIESEMYLEVRMLYVDELYDTKMIKKAYDKLAILDKIFINQSIYKIASVKDFKLELLIDKVDNEILSDILSNITSFNFDKLDVELLNTIDIFLMNNLSIANTAKELYIHRNTLIYRLDKIKQLTNLDIRIFEDAFWMVIAKSIYNKLK